MSVYLELYIVLAYIISLGLKYYLKRDWPWGLVFFAPIAFPLIPLALVSQILLHQTIDTIINIHTYTTTLVFFLLSQLIYIIPSTPVLLKSFFGKNLLAINSPLYWSHTWQIVIVVLAVSGTIAMRYIKQPKKTLEKRMSARFLANIFPIFYLLVLVGLFDLLFSQIIISWGALLAIIISFFSGGLIEQWNKAGKPFSFFATFKK
ncbi:MAG: hypothetical protein V1846_01370 [Candidatus Komeilibacteria bacterium]